MSIEDDKKHWPKDSLKRFLLRSFPGCKTALEALRETIVKKQSPPASQTPLKPLISETKEIDRFAPSSGDHKDGDIDW